MAKKPIGMFESIGQGKLYWRERLRLLPDGPLDERDDLLVRSVMETRSWANDDLARGELHMGWGINPPERAMWLHVPGKPPYRVSFLKALSPQTLRGRVMQALRGEVDGQIEAFRRPGMHVDHVYPFERLAQDWAETEGMELVSIPVEDTVYEANGFCFDRLVDRGQVDRWQDYHEANAVLQLLTPEQNMAKGAKYSADM